MAGKTRIKVHPGLARHEQAITCDPGLQMEHPGRTWLAQKKLFFAGHDYFDGTTSALGQERAVRFQDGLQFPAKAPTHVRHNHPHFMHGNPSSDATRERTTYVPCVLVQIVSLPPGSYWTTVAIGSR